jgi:hypothetical protein
MSDAINPLLPYKSVSAGDKIDDLAALTNGLKATSPLTLACIPICR